MERVSVLYREPKLLKVLVNRELHRPQILVSVLYREPKLLKEKCTTSSRESSGVSVLYREPKLLKARGTLL